MADQGQIIFFEKNKADFEQEFITIVTTEGQDIAIQMLDRSNFTPWVTTDSTDASGTNFIVELIDPREMNNILLLKYNWDTFTIQYWDGVSAFVDFSTPISEVGNTDASTRFEFDTVITSRLKVVISGTQVADAEKFIFQFIATKILGQFNGWPKFVAPTFDRNLVANEMISGKEHHVENVGGYRTGLAVANWKDAADLALIERIFAQQEGVLFWPCGGIETQFSSIRKGYRLEDIFLMRPRKDLVQEWRKGNYFTGMKKNLQLVEVIT